VRPKACSEWITALPGDSFPAGAKNGAQEGGCRIGALVDVLSNYNSFTGCPPAGLVAIGSVAGNCGWDSRRPNSNFLAHYSQLFDQRIRRQLAVAGGRCRRESSNVTYFSSARWDSFTAEAGPGGPAQTRGSAPQPSFQKTKRHGDTSNGRLVQERFPVGWHSACRSRYGLTFRMRVRRKQFHAFDHPLLLVIVEPVLTRLKAGYDGMPCRRRML